MTTMNTAGGAFRKNPLLWSLVLGLYLWVVGGTIHAHEPWRDEAELWTVARDIPTLGELWKEMPYEAHSIVWYLLMRPFARMGASPLVMSYSNLALTFCAIVLIVGRAPWPRLTKILLFFSYYLFWQFAVEVRVYVLSLFAMVLVAAVYPQRQQRPWTYTLVVSLLFNSTIMSFSMAGALMVLYALEQYPRKFSDRRAVAGLVIMGLSAVAMLLQMGILFRPADCYKPVTWHFDSAALIRDLAGLFFVGVNPAMVFMPISILLLLFCVYILFTRPRALFIFFCHFLGAFGIVALHGGSPRFYGTIWIGIFTCLWLAVYEPEQRWAWMDRWQLRLPSWEHRQGILLTLFNLCLMVSIPMGIQMHLLDRRFDYSGTQEMARFLQANRLDDLPIAAHRYSIVSAISLHMPGKEFWYTGLEKYVTYSHTNLDQQNADRISPEEAERSIHRQFAPPQPVLWLTDAPLDPARFGAYQLIYKVDNTVFGSDERCYLYRRR
jgi:hypothetical protein